MAHRILSTFRAISDNLKDSNILNYTAQLSYGLTLAVIPILMLFTFGVHFLSSSEAIQQEVSTFIEAYFPEFLSSFILPAINTTVINDITGVRSVISNIALLFFIIYASLRLLRSIMMISTKVMNEEEDRSLIKIWLLSVRFLFQLIFFLVIILAFYFESEYLVGKIDISWVEDLLQLVTSVILFFCFVLLLAWIMAKFPAQKFKLKQALPGAFFVIFGWSMLILVYRFILTSLNYPGFIQVASQGLQIIITIYLISFIMLLGFIINYTFLEEEKFDKKF